MAGWSTPYYPASGYTQPWPAYYGQYGYSYPSAGQGGYYPQPQPDQSGYNTVASAPVQELPQRRPMQPNYDVVASAPIQELPQPSQPPTDQYGPDLRSQRLSSGAKKFGIAVLMGLATTVFAAAAPQKFMQLATSTLGAIALTAYGLTANVLGLWGIINLGRGLFTKSGQYANQPAPQ